MLQFTGTQGLWNDLTGGPSYYYNTPQELDYYVKETNAAASGLTINAGAGTVTFSGAVGTNKALAALNVTASGGIAINGGAVTTEGLQAYAGDVTVGAAATTLTQTNANTDFTLQADRSISTAYGSAATLTINATRDIAIKFNATYVPGYDPADPEGAEKGHTPGILKLPQGLVQDATAVVPGTDGQKMSKSYGNVIEVFAEDKVVKKQLMGMKTDSTPMEAPKDPAATPILPLFRLFATPQEVAEVEQSFREGGKGYGHYKVRLLELFHEMFGPARKRRAELERDPAYVDGVLRDGALRARAHAEPIIKAVRAAAGFAVPS